MATMALARRRRSWLLGTNSVLDGEGITELAAGTSIALALPQPFISVDSRQMSRVFSADAAQLAVRIELDRYKFCQLSLVCQLGTDGPAKRNRRLHSPTGDKIAGVTGRWAGFSTQVGTAAADFRSLPSRRRRR
ncbi:hypothetical protein SBA3_3920025 [Candidatus Sulfopaludibacter sp. SbA3]|nr:hypothetical protein SBA3_3920025 [Candidatus Sulfopaludibacter sp. SbA3]